MLDKVPVLKQDVTISEFDSSLKEETFILSYEGKNWHISEFMQRILLLMDGTNSIKQIADSINDTYGKTVSEQEIHNIIYDKFEKAGILDGSTESPDLHNKNTSSGFLWCKISLIKSEYIQKFRFLSFLFKKAVFIPLALLSAIIPLSLIIMHYNTRTFQNLLDADAIALLYFLVISLISVLSHEFGHMAACMRYGIIPGNIGFAFYFIQPVMYSDVSKAWKLSRKQRALIDVGGVFLESAALSIIWIAGYLSGNQYITFAATLLSIALIVNFNPFIKMDGYWVFSDLTGIPNLHKTMSDYIKSKVYSIFGIKSSDPVGNINGIEKVLFYTYTVLGVIFIIFFSYGFATAFLSLILNWSKLIHLFSFNTVNASSTIMEKSFLITKIIYQGIIYILTIILLARIFIVAVHGGIKAAEGFYHRIKSQKG